MYTLQVISWSDDHDDHIDTRTLPNAHKAAEAISLVTDVSEVRICAAPDGEAIFIYVNGKQRALTGRDVTQQRRNYIRAEWNEPHDPWAVTS